MVLMADVDTNLLKQLSEEGTVRNWKDRRADVYALKLRKRRRSGR